jgi:hypothetical protein
MQIGHNVQTHHDKLREYEYCTVHVRPRTWYMYHFTIYDHSGGEVEVDC